MAQISVNISHGDDEPQATPPGRHPNTCPRCHSHYRDEELAAALRVCTQCGYHFPVGARERIGQLVDAGSFIETDAQLRSADPLAFTDLKPYTERLAEAELRTGLGDAIVVGIGRIHGHGVALAVMDWEFIGGSMGSVVGEKFVRTADLAVAHGVPLVSVATSGGARMQENTLALMQMAKTVVAVDEVREARLPFISICADPTTGGVIASFAALGDVLLAEPGALMSFAGPRVVQETTREALPEDFGRAESNLLLGHLDAIVPRAELRDTVGRLLALFAPVVVEAPVPVEPEPSRNGTGPLQAIRRLFSRGRHGPGH